MISNKTTSTTWMIDYEWSMKRRQDKEYYINVFQPAPHPAEQRRYRSWTAAYEAAIAAGLQEEGRI